ncbi:MAG: archaeosortase/exosortase family protein [Nitrospirae bacterium]|nr:archaeosortase/exosortase family protein [Nitrospirota bacterium]
MLKSGKGGLSIPRFVIIYIVMMFIFFNLAQLELIEKYLDINGVYSKWVVVLLSNTIKVFGIKSKYYPAAHGTVINLPNISLNVKFGCNGLEATIMYVFAILAFPATWFHKLKGIFIGFVVIQILNIFRLLGIIFVAIHYKDYFDYFHVYFAQSVMISVSLALFIIYIRRCTLCGEENPQ